MLTKVEVFNSRGNTLMLPFKGSTSGCLVKDITGLNPVKATIVSSSFALMDGSEYQASRRESRNIVITLGLNPDQRVTDVQTLRSSLYGFFMPKTSVTLRFFMDDIAFVHIAGMIESCDAPIFSKDPEMVISVLCFDPEFVAETPIVFSATTVNDSTMRAIVYPGTVETGFILSLAVSSVLTEFTLYGVSPMGDHWAIDVSGDFVAGDVIELSTVSGNKYATLTRTGVTSSIMYAVSPMSTWFDLFPGISMVRILTNVTGSPYTITYTPMYGGI
jgi:hypothetical protein